MEVTFHGVREHPGPAQETVRYGGKIRRVSIRSSLGQLLIPDCGTGAIALAAGLLPTEFGRAGTRRSSCRTPTGDHIQGFPFSPRSSFGNRFAVSDRRAARRC